MSRALATNVATAVASDTGTYCHLLEFQFSTGTVNYTTAPVTVVATVTGASVSSWVALGGHLDIGVVEEGTEVGGYRMALTIGAVDQTFLSLLLSGHYLNRRARVWRAYFDANLAFVSPAIPVFSGRMTQRWTVRDDERPVVRTELTDLLLDLDQVRGIPMNPEGHNAVVGITGDMGFSFVSGLGVRRIAWGGTPQLGVIKGSGYAVMSPRELWTRVKNR